MPATCLPSVRGNARFARPRCRSQSSIKATSCAAHVLDGRVDQRHVELARPASSSWRPPAGARCTSGGSVPRPVSRRTSSSQEGGARKTSSASGMPRARPAGRPAGRSPAAPARPPRAGSTRLARGAVAVARELGPLEQLAAGDQPVELVVVDEVVVDAVHLARARRRVVTDTDIQTSGRVLPQFRDDRALADPGGAGEHGQPRHASGARDRGARRGIIQAACRVWLRCRPPNSRSSAERWLVPRPRTRRDSGDAEPFHDLLGPDLADARQGFEQSGDLHLADHVIVVPSLMTSDKDVAPRLRRFFTSARSLRALAAFSRAAARSSGVRGGRATRGHLGFRWKKVCREGKLANHVPFRQRKLPVTSLQIEIYYSL